MALLVVDATWSGRAAGTAESGVRSRAGLAPRGLGERRARGSDAASMNRAQSQHAAGQLPPETDIPFQS